MNARALVLIPLLAMAIVPGPAVGQDEPEARQVTLFGVVATPDDPYIDPKLAKVAPQLRKLLPDHGFRLLGVKTKRLTRGQTLTCSLGEGFTAATTLTEVADADGKVKLKCEVLRQRAAVLESQVTTPTNQLFFCDKMLDDGTRLLVGIGAR